MSGRYPHASGERDERAHGVIQDAIDKGYLDTGRKYMIPGLPSHDVANETRLSLGRGLTHFGLCKSAWVADADGTPCYRDCQDPDGPHQAGFELHSKNAGRRYLVKQTGGDPTKLKWNPYSSKKPGRFSDSGKWIPGT
jgi:hypothetical protein